MCCFKVGARARPFRGPCPPVSSLVLAWLLALRARVPWRVFLTSIARQRERRVLLRGSRCARLLVSFHIFRCRSHLQGGVLNKIRGGEVPVPFVC